MGAESRNYGEPGIEIGRQSAKRELLGYLKTGRIESSYKEGNIPIVSAGEVQRLALLAGYTEFALALDARGGHTDLIPSRRYPQKAGEKFNVTVHAKNRYGVPPTRRGSAYSGIGLARQIATTLPPDKPEGKDELQKSVIKKVRSARRWIKKLGEDNQILNSGGNPLWDMSIDGSIHFLVNPADHDKHEYGWYSVTQLKKMANRDRSCLVLKENQPKTERTGGYSYRKYYEAELGKLSKRITGKNTNQELARRLMRVALWNCPFEDLVTKYSATLG